MKKCFLLLAAVIPAFVLSSCRETTDENPGMSAADLAEVIPGTWLSSASDADDWITYEFTETSRVNVEFQEDGRRDAGSGYYFIEEGGVLTGSYSTESGETFYLDWTVSSVSAFEIGYGLYDNNTYLGEASIYRLVSTLSVEDGGALLPDYMAVCGSRNVSDFVSLDTSVATVDPVTGEISGVSAGTAFITFRTPGGHAAIRVEVNAGMKDFAELMLGTWIYDNLEEKEWQKTRFDSSGYVYAEWTLSGIYELDESGGGYYTVDGTGVEFTITTSYGMQIQNEWTTEEINDFIWTYSVMSYGAVVGRYTGHRLLETLHLRSGESVEPDYQSLVGDYEVTGFGSHIPSVASVDGTGRITAQSVGRTYIDVGTRLGAGVIEVNVE